MKRGTFPTESISKKREKVIASSDIFCFITIIGIPFGIQHLKLAVISLFPIGQTIVDKEIAREARIRNAKETVERLKNTSN